MFHVRVHCSWISAEVQPLLLAGLLGCLQQLYAILIHVPDPHLRRSVSSHTDHAWVSAMIEQERYSLVPAPPSGVDQRRVATIRSCVDHGAASDQCFAHQDTVATLSVLCSEMQRRLAVAVGTLDHLGCDIALKRFDRCYTLGRRVAPRSATHLTELLGCRLYYSIRVPAPTSENCGQQCHSSVRMTDSRTQGWPVVKGFFVGVGTLY